MLTEYYCIFALRALERRWMRRGGEMVTAVSRAFWHTDPRTLELLNRLSSKRYE
jgi:hypothetical protein